MSIPTAENTRSADASLEELLYNAYGEDAQWQRSDGDPIADWPELSIDEQRHWRAVRRESQRQALAHLRSLGLGDLCDLLRRYADEVEGGMTLSLW